MSSHCFPNCHTSRKLFPALVTVVVWKRQLHLTLMLILHLLISNKGIEASTLVAIKFDSGIVIGTDSRTTSSSGSSYVSNMRNFYKVIPINRNVLIAQSCNNNYNNNDIAFMQQIVQQVKHIQQLQYLRYNRILSVSQLSHYIRNIVYANYNTGSSTASNHLELLIAGIDIDVNVDINIQSRIPAEPTSMQQKQRSQIYTITSSGAIIQELLSGMQYVALGTGSSYITGYLQEQLCKERKMGYTEHKHQNDHDDDDDNNTYDTATVTTVNAKQTTETLMTEQQAIEICRRAIEMAIQHDNNSGGTICIYTLCLSDSK